MARQLNMAEGDAGNEFSTWVKANGGDDIFLSILKRFGFNSRLSLKNLSLDHPDGEELLQEFNCGQRCLLRGLIELLSSDSVEPQKYAECSQKIQSLRARSKSTNVRSKINSLFNFKSPSTSSDQQDDDDFLPTPNFRPAAKKHKGKGTPGKTLQKKKVSAVHLFMVVCRLSCDVRCKRTIKCMGR